MQTVKGGNSIEKGSIICVQVKSSEKLFGDEAITLPRMAQKLGYSEFYISRKFRGISGITVCVVTFAYYYEMLPRTIKQSISDLRLP